MHKKHFLVCAKEHFVAVQQKKKKKTLFSVQRKKHFVV